MENLLAINWGNFMKVIEIVGETQIFRLTQIENCFLVLGKLKERDKKKTLITV